MLPIAGISEAEEGDRPVFRLGLVFGPSAAGASAGDPVMDASVGSNGVADVPWAASIPTEAPLFVPAEPVVMNTGVLGTVMPALSTLLERGPNSARALDSERDA
jgi:hypothetical protein